MRFSGIQDLINKMTNWQRNQWAKSGMPRDRKKVATFLKMERRNDKGGKHT